MSDDSELLQASINDFFARCDLGFQARAECDALLTQVFPGRPTEPARTQGYCSYTVFVGNEIVVQFRPSKYQLDLSTLAAAQDVYGSFAPSTQLLTMLGPCGLIVYTMNRMQGVSYKDAKAREPEIPPSVASSVRKVLCEDFAAFLARSWQYGSERSLLALGTIGRSIQPRLQKLISELPTRFQSRTSEVLSQLTTIIALPWVLTHGDIVTSNIMLDADTGRLFGFVDWAEAELLPFGTCLYGLEEILGYMTTERFVYYDDAAQCRRVFWRSLRENIAELADENVFQAVLLARDLGILLWHGFAFDDGAINRVVQEGRDDTEIMYLDTLLQHDASIAHL